MGIVLKFYINLGKSGILITAFFSLPNSELAQATGLLPKIDDRESIQRKM